MEVAKSLKMAVFTGLLIAAGYFLGSTCELIYHQYELIFSPSRELLFLFLRFLLAVGVIALSGGLVAVLLRPLWLSLLAFLLSGLAMLLAWELKPQIGILAAIYLLASALYVRGVNSEMENRIRFSVRPLSESQPILLLALTVMASAGLYLGYSAEIETEGFTIPSSLKESVMNTVEQTIEGQLEPRLESLVEDQLEALLKGLVEGQLGGELKGQLGGEPAGLLGGQLEDLLGGLVKGQAGEELKGQLEDLLGDKLENLVEGQLQISQEVKEKAKEAILSQFREQKEDILSQFSTQFDEQVTKFSDETVKPYERFIPLVFAILLFQPLFIVTRLLGSLPVWMLRALFPLLKLLRITTVETETREVERLSLG